MRIGGCPLVKNNNVDDDGLSEMRARGEERRDAAPTQVVSLIFGERRGNVL